MINRAQKKKYLDEINDIFESSKSVVFTSFDGINVDEQRDFRKKLKDSKSDYKVFKKTLLNLALDKNDKKVDLSDVFGAVGIAYSSEDEIIPMKECVAFEKDHETFKTVSCILDSEVVEQEDIKKYAALPGKDVLTAQVVGTIAAPLSGFVNVIAGNMRGLVNVLKAKAEKGE